MNLQHSQYMWKRLLNLSMYLPHIHHKMNCHLSRNNNLGHIQDRLHYQVENMCQPGIYHKLCCNFPWHNNLRHIADMLYYHLANMYLPHSKVQQAPVFQGASVLSEESQETCQGDVLAGYLVASCRARCSALLAHCEDHYAAILLESHEGSYVSLASQVEMRRWPGVGRRVFRGAWGHSRPNPSQALYYDSQASQSYAGNVCKECNLQTITAKPKLNDLGT